MNLIVIPIIRTIPEVIDLIKILVTLVKILNVLLLAPTNFNKCNTFNNNSNTTDNDSNNINNVNNCINSYKKISIKENNSVPPSKYKRNKTNSRVKHKTKKPKDNFNSNNDSDNNNFNNGGNNNPLDNENHVRHVNNTRNTMFILGDGIVINLNGYLLTKKLRNRKLIKVRSFSGATVSCMYHQFQPTIWEFNSNHLILHVGANELKSSKTASHISRSVIDFALLLKSETNTVATWLIFPRKDSLNKKAQEISNRVIDMCGECNITFVDHTDTIDIERHLN